MKKIKIILLLISLIIITGCSTNVEYTASVNQSNIYESVLFITDLSSTELENNDYYKMPLDKFYQDKNYDPYNIFNYQDDVVYYDKFIKNGTANYSQTFSLNDYYNSNMLSKLFNNFNAKYDKNNNSFKINSGKIDFYPEDIASITLNYKIDGTILYSNADKINDNVYTWIINKNNYNNKYIDLIISFGNEKEINIYKYILIIFLLLVIIFALFVSIFIYNKNKKSNKI